MEYTYATCILNETGEEINEENLTAVLEAAGCSVSESRIKAVVAALEGINIDDVTAVDLDDDTESSENECEAVADDDEGTDKVNESTIEVDQGTESVTDRTSTEQSNDSAKEAPSMEPVEER